MMTSRISDDSSRVTLDEMIEARRVLADPATWRGYLSKSELGLLFWLASTRNMSEDRRRRLELHAASRRRDPNAVDEVDRPEAKTADADLLSILSIPGVEDPERQKWAREVFERASHMPGWPPRWPEVLPGVLTEQPWPLGPARNTAQHDAAYRLHDWLRDRGLALVLQVDSIEEAQLVQQGWIRSEEATRAVAPEIDKVELANGFRPDWVPVLRSLALGELANVVGEVVADPGPDRARWVWALLHWYALKDPGPQHFEMARAVLTTEGFEATEEQTGNAVDRLAREFVNGVRDLQTALGLAGRTPPEASPEGAWLDKVGAFFGSIGGERGREYCGKLAKVSEASPGGRWRQWFGAGVLDGWPTASTVLRGLVRALWADVVGPALKKDLRQRAKALPAIPSGALAKLIGALGPGSSARLLSHRDDETLLPGMRHYETTRPDGHGRPVLIGRSPIASVHAHELTRFLQADAPRLMQSTGALLVFLTFLEATSDDWWAWKALHPTAPWRRRDIPYAGKAVLAAKVYGREPTPKVVTKIWETVLAGSYWPIEWANGTTSSPWQIAGVTKRGPKNEASEIRITPGEVMQGAALELVGRNDRNYVPLPTSQFMNYLADKAALSQTFRAAVMRSGLLTLRRFSDNREQLFDGKLAGVHFNAFDRRLIADEAGLPFNQFDDAWSKWGGVLYTQVKGDRCKPASEEQLEFLRQGMSRAQELHNALKNPRRPKLGKRLRSKDA